MIGASLARFVGVSSERTMKRIAQVCAGGAMNHQRFPSFTHGISFVVLLNAAKVFITPQAQGLECPN